MRISQPPRWVLLAVIATLPALWAPPAGGALREAGGPVGRHTVGRDANSLVQIAVVLYGDATRWVSIARWNGLKPPYRLRPGQKLALREKPALTRRRGELALRSWWKARLDARDKADPDEPYRAVLKKRGPTRAPASGADWLARGESELRSGEYARALASFQRGRRADPHLLATWFREMEALRLLGRSKEEGRLKRQLLKRRPDLASLPMFQRRPEPRKRALPAAVPR